MTYIDLFKFLKNPDSDWGKLTAKSTGQLLLFDGLGGSVLNIESIKSSSIEPILTKFDFYRTTMILNI